MGRVIRRAVPDDIDSLVSIEKKCFQGITAYPREQIYYLAFKANGTCLLEEDSGTILGFIIILYKRGTRVAGIETLDVDPAFRGLGVGERLLRSAEEEMLAKGILRVKLEVSAGNEAAVCLYKKMGYERMEYIEDYYLYEHNGTRNALRMVKHIS